MYDDQWRAITYRTRHDVCGNGTKYRERRYEKPFFLLISHNELTLLLFPHSFRFLADHDRYTGRQTTQA